MSFEGFASGAPLTPLPQALLRDLAPQMSDPAELLVTLYTVEALAAVRRYPRRLALEALRESRPLIESLSGMCVDREAATAFADGLVAACERGTLLVGRSQERDSEGVSWREWVALNDVDGRRALETAMLTPPRSEAVGRVSSGGGVSAIWQDAFGTTLPPILVDQVVAAEARYGNEWLVDAFAEAVANNARSWRYVQAILERWEQEGRDGGHAAARAAVGGIDGSRYKHLFRE